MKTILTVAICPLQLIVVTLSEALGLSRDKLTAVENGSPENCCQNSLLISHFFMVVTTTEHAYLQKLCYTSIVINAQGDM